MFVYSIHRSSFSVYQNISKNKMEAQITKVCWVSNMRMFPNNHKNNVMFVGNSVNI